MKLLVLIVIINLIYLSGASEVADIKEDESRQQNLRDYEANRYAIPGDYIENSQQNPSGYGSNRNPIPGGYIEDGQQNPRGYGSNRNLIPGGYIEDGQLPRGYGANRNPILGGYNENGQQNVGGYGSNRKPIPGVHIENGQLNPRGYGANRNPIPLGYIENGQQNLGSYGSNRNPIPGVHIENGQLNPRGYGANRNPIPGAYITTYDPARGPYTLEYPGYDLESILGPRYEVPAQDQGYYGVNSGINNYKLDARRDPEFIDYGRYPFEKLPYYQYRLEGRQGLGFDKRTAYALGMRYPLTPQLIETVERRKYSKLGSEQKPENTRN